VARSSSRLADLANELRAEAPGLPVEASVELGALRRPDVIVLLTSASEALLRSEHLRPGAIVLDDTQPRNTDPGLQRTRPDVLIVDGGLVSVPGVHITSNIDLPPGHVYACLAETMLLALEGRREHFGIGEPTADQAEHMLRLAEKHRHLGFRLAPLRSFGRRLGADRAALDGERCAA
jgi:predicted amino acid dehydrogenase